MKKLFVLSITMLVIACNIIAQKTYLLQTEKGLKFHRQDTLASFLGDIPEGVSPANALEAYQNPGKPIVFKTSERSTYDKYGIWRTPITIECSITYQDRNLVPEMPKKIIANAEFAWTNLIFMIVAFATAFISTRYFEPEDWKDDSISFVPIILVAISVIMCGVFYATSPGSYLGFTIAIGGSVCGISLFAGYMVREKLWNRIFRKDRNRYLNTTTRNLLKIKSVLGFFYNGNSPDNRYKNIMETIIEITVAEDYQNPENMTVREACRAVIFDENKMIPLLFVSKENYHKLPGGGIDSGEDKITALARELLEETGCEAKITKEIGITIESNSTRKQTSYCYIGRITKKSEPNYTNKEKEKGFELQRVTIDEAIALIKSEKRENETAKRVQQRDLAILEKAKNLQ